MAMFSPKGGVAGLCMVVLACVFTLLLLQATLMKWLHSFTKRFQPEGP